MKRVSTDGKNHREEIIGGRFLFGKFGTCLGASYENMTYAGVNGTRVNVGYTLIRVVPPSLRSLF